jgi:hypothetical protein
MCAITPIIEHLFGAGVALGLGLMATVTVCPLALVPLVHRGGSPRG